MRGSTPSRRTLRSSPSATTITATRRPRPLRACRRTTYPFTAPTAWATSRCISREETLWQKEKRSRKFKTIKFSCARCANRAPGACIWGREDYLREQYLLQLKKLCIPGGEDDFSYRRFDGAELDFQALADAIDAVPFLSERTLVEVRGYDTNKCREEEADTLIRVISDLPDYCTLVFVMDTAFEPDGRLKTTKAFKKNGQLVQFTAQGESALVQWVGKHFAAHGKNIAPEDARQLIFFTGGLMNTMIPEIDKIAAYAQGDTVTRADILAVAQRIPEAVVYELTDCLANQDYDGAMRILADLLADKSNTPIFLLAVIGQQMRRLYAARLARRAGIGTSELREMLGVPYDFIAENLLRSARKFTGRQLEEAVRLCAQADFAMKSSGADDMALLKELLLRIAVGGAA